MGVEKMPSSTKKKSLANGRTKVNPEVETQYGGKSKAGWLRNIPPSWLPYIHLIRISPPIGPVLTFWHTVWGTLLGIAVQGSPLGDAWRPILITLLWSLFFSNTMHIWNDLIDAPLDAQVERTRHRPIPSGAVSPTKAFVFFLSQFFITGAIMMRMHENLSLLQATMYVLPAAVLGFYYPWSKRHDPAPQLTLGLTFCGCSVVGFVTAGMMPFVTPIPSDGTGLMAKLGANGSSIEKMILYQGAASCLFVMVNDTIYAHQDLKDDLKNGTHSLAVLIQGFPKAALFLLTAGAVWTLYLSGYYAGFGTLYNLISVGGFGAIVVTMVARVKLDDSKNCWWWFERTHIAVGIAICSGIVAEYLIAIK